MATQRDIAEKLGVSVSLVSRVLSGKAEAIGVKDDTIRQVRKTAERMGYVPNVPARILKGASAMTLGVLVYDFEDPFFGSIIGALQELAGLKGYSLVLAGFHRRRVTRRDLQPLLKHQIDGLVIVGSDEMADWTEPFRQRGIPMVRIGTGPSPEDVSVVCVDEARGMRMLLEHLASLGHTRIGFIGGSHAYQRIRYVAFRETVARCGLNTEEAWCVLSGRHVSEAGYEATRDLLTQRDSHLPTALVASSDLMALGALRALAEKGYRVPRDMSVAGFDDIPIAAMAAPPLTTVRQPFTLLTEKALGLLVGESKAPRSRATPLRLQPSLVTRASCGKPGSDT